MPRSDPSDLNATFRKVDSLIGALSKARSLECAPLSFETHERAGEMALELVLSDDPRCGEAIDLMIAGQVDGGLNVLFGIAASSSEDPGKTWRCVGALAECAGNLDVALTAYERAINSDPPDFWGHIFLGRLVETSGQASARRTHADAALQASANEREQLVALIELGDALSATADVDGAGEAYFNGLAIARGLARRNPDERDCLRDLSVILERIGDLEMLRPDLLGARRAFSEAWHLIEILIGRFSDDSQLLVDRGIIFMKLGQVEERSTDLSEADKYFTSAARLFAVVPTAADVRGSILIMQQEALRQASRIAASTHVH